ncbi:hypothetical protein [Hymenobacter chitinivorans]|uniref:SH3 domain-containing protein n=1 Tax=Hymenobacter chitinivorans DSM 11115 TaxID=1121954 RepID=A0A2M9BNM8_9BACT|nr:hypothetical protein [Hymenobacter chitinivorans]PJJ59548.1 hypothetical protein CLV45_0967 [Hymenobacter chitinivorans DSM 11115]
MHLSVKFLGWGVLLVTACQPDSPPATTPAPPHSSTLPAATPDSTPATPPTAAQVPLDSTPAAAAAAAVSLEPPADVTAADPALAAFVRQLMGYAQRRQREQLLAAADDNIVISYGGGVHGKKEFAAYLNDPDTNGYGGIRRALQLGGAPDDPDQELAPHAPSYAFPYFQSTRYWKNIQADEDVDPYSTYVGLTGRVEVHARPGAQSPVRAALRYPLLVAASDSTLPAQTDDWLLVQTADGKTRGFVAASTVYCAANMKLVIAKKRGAYKILSVAPFD